MKVAYDYDPLLYWHSLHVASFAAPFTAYLGYPPQDQYRIVQASLLHDLGKIYIPHSLLNKPAPLSAREFGEVQRHPEIGYALLAEEVQDDLILDVVLHHHERLDGSGYPDRLRGTEISDSVRLVTICDIYAAMTEVRPYRAQLSAQKAFQTMWSMTDGIDSMLLDVFKDSQIWKEREPKLAELCPIDYKRAN